MKTFLATTMLAFASLSANAAITVDLQPPGPGGISELITAATAVGPLAGQEGNYLYKYDADLSPSSTIKAGDFFVFYDVFGYTTAYHATTDAQAGVAFSVSSVAVGPGVPNVTPTSDTARPNVLFTYTGSDITTTSSTFAHLGEFHIVSTSGIFAFTQGAYNSNASNGSSADGIQGVEIPSDVPEPATMSLMGGALLGLGMLARRRK